MFIEGVHSQRLNNVLRFKWFNWQYKRIETYNDRLDNPHDAKPEKIYSDTVNIDR